MFLLLDNYDSFTFNIAQYVQALGAPLQVLRNDQVTVAKIEARLPSGIILSPGPGRPEHAGISEVLIRRLCDRLPILGICLGHQAIGQVCGARIVSAKRIMHGKTDHIHHNGRGLFAALPPQPFVATRYHSLTLERQSLPAELEPHAWSGPQDNEVMAIRHRQLPLEGLQFHPESLASEHGLTLIGAFLKRCGTTPRQGVCLP